jgi:hypothetical protein
MGIIPEDLFQVKNVSYSAFELLHLLIVVILVCFAFYNYKTGSNKILSLHRLVYLGTSKL